MNVVKHGFILMFASIIASGSLSLVYHQTEPIIEQAKSDEIKNLLTEVFPSAADFHLLEGFEPVRLDKIVKIKEIYIGFDDEELRKGLVAKVEVVGYGGPILILVGITKEEKIVGIKVVEHKETPGLGSKITGVDFLNRFTGKSLRDPFEVKTDIEAITGATKSSVAVTKAVQKAATLILQNKEVWLK